MSVKILHTSDLHLGSTFDGLPPEKASERKNGQFDVLKEILLAAELHRVQAILISGDLFDQPIVSPDVVARTVKVFTDTAIPIFIAPGNHDFYHARSPYHTAVWPDHVHIFRSAVISCVELSDLVVYGAGFTDQNVFRSFLSDFHAKQSTMTEGLHQSKPSVMVLHGEINPPEARYGPISPAEIAASGLDYLALGHIHQRTEPQKAGRTIYAFSGCPEGRGFDESGQKGCYLVELGDTNAVRFLPLHGFKYYSLPVDITGSVQPSEAVLQALPSHAEKDIIKIVLEGEADPKTFSLVHISELVSPFVYHAIVHDNTTLPRNIWAQAGDDSLIGIFLSLLTERRNTMQGSSSSNSEDGLAKLSLEMSVTHQTPDIERLIELAARYGIAALNGEEAPKR